MESTESKVDKIISAPHKEMSLLSKQENISLTQIKSSPSAPDIFKSSDNFSLNLVSISADAASPFWPPESIGTNLALLFNSRSLFMHFCEDLIGGGGEI